MKKVFEVLKKYLVIGFVLSMIIDVFGIVSMIRSNTLPTVNLLYIIKFVFGTFGETVLLVPVIAIIDLFIVKVHMSLVKDFKEADRKGRIIIIVSVIIVLLRKIVIWTR